MFNRSLWLIVCVCALLSVSSKIVLAAGSVSGSVWIDKNNNGINDDNKPVSHVPVYLRQGSCAGEIVDTQTTGTGTYTFGLAPVDTYVIQVVNPADGYIFTTAGADMNVDSATGCSDPFVLNDGGSKTIGAGFRVKSNTIVSCGAIPLSDLSWINGNTKSITLNKFFKQGATLTSVDLKWSTLVSHTVSVQNNSQVEGDITVDFTDHLTVHLPNGSALDNLILPPTFIFSDVMPNGGTKGPATLARNMEQSLAYPPPLTDFIGSNAADLIPFSVTGTAASNVIAPGTYTLDVTSRAQGTLCVTYAFLSPAKIGGRVYQDKNRNGIFDGNDNNMAGVQVCLYSTKLVACQGTNTSKSSVNFKFKNIASGVYSLTVTPPPNFDCINPPDCSKENIVLPPGANDLSHQFGLAPSIQPLSLKDIVYEETTHTLFSPDHDANQVIQFDPNTLTPIANVGVGKHPFGIAALGGEVYAANFDSNSISVINASTMGILKTIDLKDCGSQPTHIAANPSTNKLYVALHGSGRVAVLDGASNTLTTCIDGVGGGTFGIAVNSSLNRIYVTGRDSFDLRVINGATDTRIDSQTQTFDGSPYQVTTDPNNNHVYLAVSTPDPDFETVTRFYVYDATAGGLTLVSSSPFTINNNHDGGGIGASPCSGKIYIAESAHNTVRVLNSDLSLNTILNISPDPFGIAFGDGKVFFTERSAGKVSSITECP